MNAKELKYMSLIENMFRQDYLTEQVAHKSFTSLLNLDFALAQNVWEYICTTYENKLGDTATATVMGGKIFDLFYSKSPSKTIKALSDAPSVRRAVYTYSPAATSGNAFTLLTDLLSANKTDVADDLFKCLIKNDRIQYGPFMKELLERLFIELLKKSATKKLELNRKLGMLLLQYVAKIKTDERAMLEQRIRERM